MGIFDDFFGGVFDNLFVFGRSDKKMEKLMNEGEIVPGTLYAVKVREHSETTDDYWYGFDLQTPSGPLRATVKQRLAYDPRIRLGATLALRHLDGRIGVDWAETVKRDGEIYDQPSMPGKTLKKSLEPGIDDSRNNAKRIAKGNAATATIGGFRRSEVMGMPTENVDIELMLEDQGPARQVLVKRANVPDYCLHLLVEGALLPVAVDPNKPDKVTIDWKRAGEQGTKR